MYIFELLIINFYHVFYGNIKENPLPKETFSIQLSFRVTEDFHYCSSFLLREYDYDREGLSLLKVTYNFDLPINP